MSKYTETEIEYFYNQAGYRPGDTVTVWGNKRLKTLPQTGTVLEVGPGWVRVEVHREGGPITGGFRTLKLPWRSVGKDNAPMPRIKGTPKVHLTAKEKQDTLKHNGKICFIYAGGKGPMMGQQPVHKFMTDAITDTGRTIPAGTVGTYYGKESRGINEYAKYILKGETKILSILM